MVDHRMRLRDLIFHLRFEVPSYMYVLLALLVHSCDNDKPKFG